MDTAKKMVKAIKDQGFKAQAAIQGDQLRISSKSKDDLQKVQAFLARRRLGDSLAVCQLSLIVDN